METEFSMGLHRVGHWKGAVGDGAGAGDSQTLSDAVKGFLPKAILILEKLVTWD